MHCPSRLPGYTSGRLAFQYALLETERLSSSWESPSYCTLTLLTESIRRAIHLVGADRIVTGEVQVAREDANIAVAHQALQRAQIGSRAAC